MEKTLTKENEKKLQVTSDNILALSIKPVSIGVK
jgi:hypothetical protein